MQGFDIRKYGMKYRTSNVARTLGKKAAIQTLLGDGLKGLVMLYCPGVSYWMNVGLWLWLCYVIGTTGNLLEI
jgi:glycerol-3-phosphate acyltransferase PlsY